MDEVDIALAAAVLPTEIEVYLGLREIQRRWASYLEERRVLDVSAARAAESMKGVRQGARRDELSRGLLTSSYAHGIRGLHNYL